MINNTRKTIQQNKDETMTIHNYIKAIEQRCDKDEDTGCWNWTRATHHQGYGLMRYGQKGMMNVCRIMAIEANLFDNIDFHSRIGTSCDNKLCVNPDHIIKQTHTEVMQRRYDKQDTNGKMYGREKDIRTEYLKMKEHRIPRTINILSDKYDCHPTVIYRAIHKANKFDNISTDFRAYYKEKK